MVVADDGRPVLMGSCCGDCGALLLPPAPVCPQCLGEKMNAQAFPREGVVYSCSTVHVGPKHWHKPYTLAYVDLDNGVRVFARLQGGADIGQRVSVAAIEAGCDAEGRPLVGIGFAPVETSHA